MPDLQDKMADLSSDWNPKWKCGEHTGVWQCVKNEMFPCWTYSNHLLPKLAQRLDS